MNIIWLLAILFGTIPVQGMEPKCDVINQNQENQIQETSCLLQLPNEVINHIAGYCQPIEKDLLMKVCQSLHKRLQDKETMLLANPFTVTLSHKRKKMFEYVESGDAIKLSAWLSVLGATEINKAYAYGRTPLYIASQKDHIKIVQLLLNAGANVNKADNRGITPLHWASSNGYMDVVQVLLGTHGINVNQANSWGGTPLHEASVKGHTYIAQLLIKHGADVNKTKNNGETPLHVASYNGHTESVQLLLNAGADVNQIITTIDSTDPIIEVGDTALQIAHKKGHTQIVELIEEYLQREETIKAH